MSDSVWPHRWQPTRLPHPWDSPGKNTGVGCHFLLQCMKVKSESEVAQSCLTLCDPMDYTQAYAIVVLLHAKKLNQWQQQKEPTVFGGVTKCCWGAGSISDVRMKAANVFSHCACTSHLPNIKRLKSTSSKLGSLKAIFLLSIKLELLWSWLQIKVKLFYLFF